MRGGSGGAWAILGLWLAGCGGPSAPPGRQAADGLARYPEAEPQILAYYASQGSGEPTYRCGRGTIARIERARIILDLPVEVVIEITYRFEAEGLPGGSSPCSGVSTRWFTFDREGDGRLSLSEMSELPP